MGKRLIHLGGQHFLWYHETCLTSRRSQVRVLHCPPFKVLKVIQLGAGRRSFRQVLVSGCAQNCAHLAVPSLRGRHPRRGERTALKSRLNCDMDNLLKLHEARWAELLKGIVRACAMPQKNASQQTYTDDCDDSNYRQHVHSCSFSVRHLSPSCSTRSPAVVASRFWG